MAQQTRRTKTVVRVTSLLGVAVLGASLAACSSNSGTDTSGAGQSVKGQHINVLAEDISYTDNMKAMLPQFEKESGISVTISTVPYTNQASKIALNFSQKSDAYDVVFNDNVYGVGYYDSKNVVDLTPYEKAGAKYGTVSSFYKPYIAPMTKDGKVFGLPVYGESTWLMYRKDLFSQYGISGPPKTMDELEADAKIVEQKSGGKIAGITLRGAPGIQNVYPWSGFLRAFGGNYTNSKGKIDVDSPQAIEAAQFWANLLKDYGPSGASNFDWQQNTTAFTNGDAAMTIDATANGPYNEDPSSSKVVGKVGYAAVPYAIPNPPTSGNTNNSLEVHGMYVSAYSKHKQAAYDFIAWATSEAVQAHAVKTTEATGVTNTAVLNSSEFASKYGAFQKEMLAQLKTGNPDYLPAGNDSNAIITDVGQALSTVLAGQQTAKAAMTQAQTQIEQQTNQ